MKNRQSKIKVLIVEDDAFQALLVDKLITKMGFSTIGKVASGEDAIKTVLEKKPDIILMDISLEGEVDGITAIEKIKEKDNIPVIYITGNSDSYNLDRAEKTGFVDYLIKPISGKMLEQPMEKARNIVVKK
jgi:two-component system, response regulator PdtaR